MKVFKKDSWHYWVAGNFGGFRGGMAPTDICTYTTAVMKGILSCLCLLAVGITMVVALSAPIVWVTFRLIHGVAYEMSTMVQIGTGLWICIIVWALWFVLYTNINIRIKYKNDPVPPDSFLTEAYKSIKNKMCVKITFD